MLSIHVSSDSGVAGHPRKRLFTYLCVHLQVKPKKKKHSQTCVATLRHHFVQCLELIGVAVEVTPWISVPLEMHFINHDIASGKLLCGTSKFASSWIGSIFL